MASDLLDLGTLTSDLTSLTQLNLREDALFYIDLLNGTYVFACILLRCLFLYTRAYCVKKILLV